MELKHCSNTKRRYFITDPQVGDRFEYLGGVFECVGSKGFARRRDSANDKSGTIGTMLIWSGTCGACGDRFCPVSSGRRLPEPKRCSKCKKKPGRGWHRKRVRAGMVATKATGTGENEHGA